MDSKFNKTVLVAPLDWGLGHASRLIPIIRSLNELGCRVLIAADGAPARLLQQEFPQITVLPLKGYGIGYSSKKDYFRWKIAAQVPKILQAIKQEHLWLKKVVAEHGIDAVISDNRYGLYHAAIPSVFITHQLSIRSGISKSIDRLLQKRNYNYIHRFTECWIPDTKEALDLAGELSHPVQLPANAKYIGWLSAKKTGTDIVKDIDISFVLSGPEPQRTLLEKQLSNQLENFHKKVVLVRGLPTEKQSAALQIRTSADITVFNHLPSDELSTLIQRSKLVICRSGYSSLMDLVKLHQKAILIPTPGQTEQEYLGKYLSSKNMFLSCSQESFELSKAIKAAEEFPFQLPSFKEDQQEAIKNFLQRL